MLSALPPPATSAPPLRPSGTTIYPSPSPTTFSTSSACSSFTILPRLPRRPLASVHSSSHLSNPLLFSLPLSRPPVTTTKRGPQPPSATPSSAPLPPSPGLWDNLKAAVAGIPTPVLIAILAVAVIYAASRVFAPPQPAQRERTRVETPPPPPPIQLGEITEDELRQYDGTDPSKPLLMAIKGQIYDVSQGRLFYGPGGPYALFAGKDASRALAKMSFEEKDLNGDISDLGPFELGALQDWEYKFTSKYVTVGTIKNPEAPVIGDTVSASGVVGSNGSLNVSDITETNKAAVSPDDVVLEGSSVPSDDVQIKEVGGEENSAESIKN